MEIQSGGRAYDEGRSPRVEPTISPTRAALKARKRRRILTAVAIATFGLMAIVGWAWLSNPNAFVPADAMARVNGEFIYERDVTREMDIRRTINDLDPAAPEPPGAASVLEELITRKARLQAAKSVGVSLTPQEEEAALEQVLSITKLTREQLEAALAKRNLTLDDMRAFALDLALVNKYISTEVVKGAKTTEEAQNKRNEWEVKVAQTAVVERFKPAGAGPAPRIGSEAPDFTLKDLDGNEVKLSDLRGRPVMINFWATWCPPCRAEIPDIVEMYDSAPASERPYEVLGIAIQSDLQTVKAFTEEFNMTFPVLPDPSSQVTSLYHVLPIPTSFFIDADGVIRDMRVGMVDRALMEKWLLGK